MEESDSGAGKCKVRIGVRPRPDETLAGYLQSLEQARDCILITIGPTTDGIDRALDCCIVLAYRSVLPVGIASLVLQPIFLEQRYVLKALQPHRSPVIADQRRIGREAHQAEKENELGEYKAISQTGCLAKNALPILDPMASWAPHWRSGISDAAWMEFLGYSADDFLRIAEQLGVSTMTVIGTFQPGLVAIPETAESFALLADKARSHGLHCVLEFIPLWGIGDLASAWQILKIANRPNTGLAFDFWHYIQGGRDDALLRSIPGSKISYVQVTDAEASLPTGRSLFDDCLFHRLPPGQGGLTIKQLLDILCEIGGIERLGPEVFSAKLDASSAEEIGQALREPYWQALANSWIG